MREDGVRDLCDLCGEIRRDTRRELKRRPALTRAHLEALLRGVAEPIDEWRTRGLGKRRRIRGRFIPQSCRELVLQDRADDRCRQHCAELLDRAEDTRCRAGETGLKGARAEIEERSPHTG